jgi:hypothetical protein
MIFSAVKISKGLKQAYDLQDFTYEAAMALKRSLRKGRKLIISREDASSIWSIVRAWESCQERIRIHRNKPMPGVLRPERKKPKQPSKSADGVLNSVLPASEPK